MRQDFACPRTWISITSQVCRTEPSLAGSGWVWLGLVGSGWVWLGLAGHQLTRRPDSDGARPLAGPGRARLPGLAGFVQAPGAAARGESHPGPAAAASPSSGGPGSALGALQCGGSDP